MPQAGTATGDRSVHQAVNRDLLAVYCSVSANIPGAGTLFNPLKRWWHQRIIRRSVVTGAQWNKAFSALPLLDRLSADDRQRLRELAILFMHGKSFSGASGLVVTDAMRRLIALQACLPILNLGIEWYRNWVSIIIYPAGFVPERIFTDEYGLEHRVKQALSGEAWQQGPVILSWEAATDAGERDGSNVVIHEFVHKLDMLNGSANGFPPLHNSMDPVAWTQAFHTAFEDFRARTVRGEATGISAYAATSPAEFIAVLSEVFFETPEAVERLYPAVYDCLKAFFRQDPDMFRPDGRDR